MTESAVLDLTVVGLIVLAGIAGAWRGGISQGIIGGCLVVTGALVIAPPMVMIAERSHGGEVGVASVGLLIGLTASVCSLRKLRPPAGGGGNRAVGALCGALNVLWITTFVLAQWPMTNRAGAGTDWRSGTIAERVLVANVEVVLLAISSVVVVVSGILAVSTVWMHLSTVAPERSTWRYPGPALSGASGLRLPRGADAGKVDPHHEHRPSHGVAMTTSWTSNRSRSMRGAGIRPPLVHEMNGSPRRSLPSPTWYRIAPRESNSPRRRGAADPREHDG